MTETVAEAYERLTQVDSPEALETLLSLREECLAQLLKQDTIEVGDVLDMDRLGRFGVAQKGFGLCTPAARQVLLNDHPHVTAAARMSERRLEQ